MRKLILCCILLAGLSATAQKKLTDFLPEKTRTLVALNPLKLANKIPGETFRQSFLYRELMKEPESPPAKIFRDPAASGIDLANIFIVTSEGSSPTLNITHVMAKLSSRQTLEELLFSTGLPREEVKVYGTDHIFLMGDKGVLAWNNDIVILANRKGYDEEEPVMANPADTMTIYDGEVVPAEEDTSTAAIEKWLQEQMEYQQKALRDLAFDLLTPRPANRLSADTRFASLLASNGDILIWNEDKGSSALSPVIPMQGLLGRLGTLVSGQRAVNIVFENGKLAAYTTEYHSPEIRAILDEHPHQPAGDEMIRQLPGGKLLALLNASYNDAFFRQLLGKDVMKELADSVMKFTNIDITTIGKVFGKKMMMAVVENPGAKPRVNLVFVLPIADMNAFNAMKSALMPLYDSLRRSDSDFLKKMNPVIRHNDQMMVLSLSETMVENFMSRKEMQDPPGWVKDYTGYPMMIDIDLKEIVKVALSDTPPRQIGEGGLNMLNSLDRIRIFGGEYKNGATTTTVEFRLSDPGKNSLQQLFEMIGSILDNQDAVEMTPEQEDVEVHYDTTTVSIELADTLFAIPEFKDKKARQFAEDYMKAVIAYRRSLSDSARNMEAETNYLVWNERARVIDREISDKEEMRKLRDFIIMVRGLIPPEADIVPKPPVIPPGNREQ